MHHSGHSRAQARVVSCQGDALPTNGAFAKSISTRRDRADERLDSNEQPLVSNVDLPPQEPLDRRKRQEDEIQRERELESSSHLVEKAAACEREADHLIEGRVLGRPSLLEAGQLRQSLCVREEAVLFHEGEEPLSEHPASPHSRVEGADRLRAARETAQADSGAALLP